jgi:hypothetical protein
MESMNFGPRFDADGAAWVNENGTPADRADVGMEVSVDPDGCLRIAIGDAESEREWFLCGEQAWQLAEFLHRDATDQFVTIPRLT